MDNKIPIKKAIYSNSKFREVIDTDFSELTKSISKISVEDFFNLYNELFLEIPYTGEYSHTTLSVLSQQVLQPGGKDAKDKEIENLQAMLEDLQKQLLESSTDLSITREHPRFNNGTLIRRPEGSMVGWPDVFIMDQGFKRAIYFSDDSGGMYTALKDLLKYTDDWGTNPIPRIPDMIIDDIPSGEPLTSANFNDNWTPSKGIFEAEEFRISLDPSDANLNFDNYNGDAVEYRSALDKDYEEKTNLIVALEEKIADFTQQIQKILS